MINFKLNGILFAQSLIATAHGFWIVSSLLTAVPFLFDLNVFSDTNMQPNDAGIYSIIETCFAFVSFCVSLVGSFTILASVERKSSSVTQFTLGAFYILFFGVCLIFLAFRMNKMGIFYDWNIGGMDKTCRDSSFGGNPTARLELAGYEIKSVSDCIFNAYDPDLVNINQFGSNSSEPMLIDWSNVNNYDHVNAAVLAQSAQSAGVENIDAAAMPKLHEYWYWGCHPICHPRHRLNFIYLVYDIVSVVIYLTLAILSFAAGVESNRMEQNKKKDNVNEDNFDKEGASPDGEEGYEEFSVASNSEVNKRNWSSIRF